MYKSGVLVVLALMVVSLFFDSCTEPEATRNNVVLIELITDNDPNRSQLAAMKLNTRTDGYGVYANEDIGKFINVKLKDEAAFRAEKEVVENRARDDDRFWDYINDNENNVDPMEFFNSAMENLNPEVELIPFKNGIWYLSQESTFGNESFEKGNSAAIVDGEQRAEFKSTDFTNASLEFRNQESLINNLQNASLQPLTRIEEDPFTFKKIAKPDNPFRLHQNYNKGWVYKSGDPFAALNSKGINELNSESQLVDHVKSYNQYVLNNSLTFFRTGEYWLSDIYAVYKRSFGGLKYNVAYLPGQNSFSSINFDNQIILVDMLGNNPITSTIIDTEFDGYLVQYSYTTPTYQPMAEYLPFIDANDKGGAKTWTSVKIEDENGVEIIDGHPKWDKWKFTLDNEYTFMKGNRFRYKLGTDRATKETDYVEDDVNYIYGTYKDLSVEGGAYVVEFAFPNNPTAQDGADQFNKQTVEVLGEPNYVEFKIKLKESDYYEVPAGEQDDEVTLTIKVKEEVRWEDFNNAN